jgi:hypothetical protein
VWQQCDGDDRVQCADGDTEIYLWDGSFPIAPFQVTDNSINDRSPAISGSRVVWEGMEDSVPVEAIDVYFWDGSFPIVPILLGINSDYDWVPDISGSTVVWVGQADGQQHIFQWDGTFPIAPTLINPPGGWRPTISGSNVAFEYPPFISDIYVWDGVTSRNISNDLSTNDEYPDISGSSVVWQSCVWDSYVGCISDGEIYAAAVPTAPPDVPAISFVGLVLLIGLMIGAAVYPEAYRR